MKIWVDLCFVTSEVSLIYVCVLLAVCTLVCYPFHVPFVFGCNKSGGGGALRNGAMHPLLMSYMNEPLL